jgi:LPXTG-motif cell wall-anchored protein
MRCLRMFFRCAVLLGSLALAGGSAFGQSLPPGPTARFQSTFDVAPPASAFEIVQLVLDYAPGAWTLPHHHGGNGYFTVLDGEVTLRAGGAEQTFESGGTFVERAGELQETGNSGPSEARLLGTFLLPKGAPLTTPHEARDPRPPEPTTVSLNRIDAATVGAADLIESVLNFGPGAWTPSHVHGGQTLNTVLAGEITLREGGEERELGPGQAWSDRAGQVHAAGNDTAGSASLAAVFLVPKGQTLTTVQPASLPRTGDASAPVGLGFAAVLLMIAGWVLRRVRRHVS